MSQNVLRMPRLSDSMSEATIVGWLKQPGDAFLRGEPLVEVETDKATVVYEAEADGLLVEILVPEGGAATLGAPIARLGGDDGEAPQATADAAPAVAAAASRPDVAAPPVLAATQPATATRARATPVARQTAAQLGISLFGLDGTGPGGRIRKLDVVRAGASAPAAAAPEPMSHDLKGPTTVVALSATGETIARRMSQSRSEIPSFDVVMRVDVSAVVQLRRGAGDLVEAVPSVNDFVVKAAALALREFPAFNSSFVNGRSERHGRVNVGIAVATEDALLVPAVVDADANHPQVAILAVGAAQRSPVETPGGGVEFRDIAELTLTSDHRAVYGADAARFLGHLRQLLEHPLALVL